MRQGKRFWAVPVCLAGGFSFLCFAIAFCEWCRANEFNPFGWVWSHVMSLARALGGGG